MPNRLTKGEFALAVLVTSLFWIAVLALGTSYSTTIFWEKTTSDPVAMFTLVLAVSTIGLWAATIGLYFAGEKQFRLARDEFAATHRPKLIVRSARLASSGERGIQARVDYEVVNIGESEATVINLHAFAYIQSTDTGFNPFLNAPPQEPNRERFRLTSGEYVLVCTPCPSIDVQYPDFQYADGKLFVLGVITYLGPDQIKRITGFCRRYSQETGAWHAENETDYEYAY